MLITFEDRPSDSPFVERIWRSRSEGAGRFQSMANCNWVLVVSRHRGEVSLTIRGPETVATEADCPADGEWVGIHFRPGTFMPLFPPGRIRDRNDVTLPRASGRGFRLDASAWEYPTFANADVFVQRLVNKGLVVADPLVAPVLRDSGFRDATDPFSPRSRQRHFLRATGVTRATFRQIERARRATALLRDGDAILDVVAAAGYFDQAHLTRSLKRFVGLTPAQVARGKRQLSLLYKTGDV